MSFELKNGEYYQVNNPPTKAEKRQIGDLFAKNKDQQSTEDNLCRYKRENFRTKMRNDFLKSTFSQKRRISLTKSVKQEKKEPKTQLSDQKFSQNNQHRKEEEEMLQEEDVWDNYQDIYKTFQTYSYGFLDSFTLQRQVEWQLLIRKQKSKRNGIRQRRRNQFDYLNCVSVQTQTKMEVYNQDKNKLVIYGSQYKKKINLTQINHTYKIELEYKIKHKGKSQTKIEYRQNQMNNSDEKLNGLKLFELQITPIELDNTIGKKMNQQEIHSSNKDFRLLLVNKEVKVQAINSEIQEEVQLRQQEQQVQQQEPSQTKKYNNLKKILTGKKQVVIEVQNASPSSEQNEILPELSSQNINEDGFEKKYKIQQTISQEGNKKITQYFKQVNTNNKQHED